MPDIYCTNYTIKRYHNFYPHKQKLSTRFSYHCAQSKLRQEKSKKGQREGAKPRDKESMDVFDCSGWLHIYLNENDTIAFVKLKHEDDHVAYWCIDVPKEVRSYVLKNCHLSPAQVSNPEMLSLKSY